MRSARCVVPHVLDLIKPESVVDFGCGTGAWLKVFSETENCNTVVGFDYGDVDADQLLIKESEFQKVDLTKTINLNRRFDLVLSLEVAEHIEEHYASQFLENLASLSDVVLFSAAIPGQRGRNHVNKRFPSYWADKFLNEQGYQVADVVRKKIWQSAEVEFWYRQNILLFCSPTAIKQNSRLAAAVASSDPKFLDIVHPLLFEKVREEYKEHLSSVHQAHKDQIRYVKAEIWERAKKSFSKT